MADQASPAPFFNPDEPPPDFAQPPADDRLTQIITKLAQFASRNGPGFVDVIRQKQAGNNDYNFLSGGEGAAYWRWYLYCTLYNLPPGAVLALPSQHHSHTWHPTGIQPRQSVALFTSTGLRSCVGI